MSTYTRGSVYIQINPGGYAACKKVIGETVGRLVAAEVPGILYQVVLPDGRHPYIARVLAARHHSSSNLCFV